MDPKPIAIAAGLSAVTIAGLLVFGSASPSDPTITPETRTAAVQAFSEFRQGELLSGLVEPGNFVDTGANLPPGGMTVGALVLTGDAVGHFVVVDQATEGTWFHVRAQNMGVTPARLSAVIGYQVAIDAGVAPDAP